MLPIQIDHHALLMRSSTSDIRPSDSRPRTINGVQERDAYDAPIAQREDISAFVHISNLAAPRYRTCWRRKRTRVVIVEEDQTVADARRDSPITAVSGVQ